MRGEGRERVRGNRRGEREREELNINKQVILRRIVPIFLMTVVASWRYLERVKLKNVHGQRSTATMA